MEIRRIKKIIEYCGEAQLNFIYTKKEIDESKVHKDKFRYFARIFAAKESTFKALSNMLHSQLRIRMSDIEILNAGSSQPSIRLDGKATKLLKYNKVEKIFASASSDGDYAIAIVIIEHAI